MPQVYMPTGSTYEYLKGLLYGFYLEIEKSGTIVLIVKLEAAHLMSIINGCQIELFVRNPHIDKRSCTLYVFDLPNDPVYVTWRQFGEPHAVAKDLDDVIYKLATETKTIKLALFNELSHPIFTTDIPIQSSPEDFHKWLYRIYNDDEYQNVVKDIDGNYFPESDLKGYPIKLLNRDHSNEPMMQILAPEYEDAWRQNQSSKKGSFKLSDYQGDGKHGNLQELSITNILSRLLEVNKDFFVSPKNLDGTEFTDFVIINNNAAIVIESKYVISTKSTKKLAAIIKAIKQLNRVEDTILDKQVALTDTHLTELLQKVSVVIKLCILNDRIILSDEKCTAVTQQFDKSEMPVFISNTGFGQLLGGLWLKNKPFISHNLFFNIIQLYKEYLENDEEKIFYRRYFKIENLTVDELNNLNN